MSVNNSNTRRSRSRSVRRTRRNNSRNTKLLKYDEEIASLRRQISRMNARLLDLENKKRLLVLENTEHIYNTINTIPDLRLNSNSSVEFDMTSNRIPPLLTPSPSPSPPLPLSSQVSPDYSSAQLPLPIGKTKFSHYNEVRKIPKFDALYANPNFEGPRQNINQDNSNNTYQTIVRALRNPSRIRRNNLGGGSRKTRKIRRN